MNVLQFADMHPDYCFDFSDSMKHQRRIFDLDILNGLPVELLAVYPYTVGGRGRTNRNQTRTHFQCGTCKRVLRNDKFVSSEAMVEKNRVFSHCKECSKKMNAERYADNAKIISLRREVIWKYIAMECRCCGFNKHHVAIDMHHMGEDKTGEISSMITELTFVPSHKNAVKLLDEVAKCIALCANCHRMHHAGVIQLDQNVKPKTYHVAELMLLLAELEPSKQIVGSVNDSENLPLFVFA